MFPLIPNEVPALLAAAGLVAMAAGEALVLLLLVPGSEKDGAAGAPFSGTSAAAGRRFFLRPLDSSPPLARLGRAWLAPPVGKAGAPKFGGAPLVEAAAAAGVVLPNMPPPPRPAAAGPPLEDPNSDGAAGASKFGACKDGVVPGLPKDVA